MYVQIQSVVKTPTLVEFCIFLRKKFDALCGQKHLIYHKTYNWCFVIDLKVQNTHRASPEGQKSPLISDGWSTTATRKKNNRPCVRRETHIHRSSVFDDSRFLVFRSQLELFLPLHVAVTPHDAQVASVHGQQHHGGGESPIAKVSQPLPRHHGEDPGREQEIKLGSAAKHERKDQMLLKHLLYLWDTCGNAGETKQWQESCLNFKYNWIYLHTPKIIIFPKETY